MRITLIIFTTLISGITTAQQYSGIIKDKSSGEPVPFVNIGIFNKGVGTVSQVDGTFKIILADELQFDTLRISIIGYRSETFIVKDFIATATNGYITVNLTVEIQQLNTVFIRPRNMKQVTLGNTFDKPNIMAGFKTNDLGAEIGTIMKIKNGKEYYLKSAGFNIAKCVYDSILFRVNIYSLKDNKPFDGLHSLPIYVKAVKGQRQILVDLVPYNIVIDQDFVLSLEWIEDLPDKTTDFTFCAGFIGNRIFWKQTSEASWATFPVGIGSWCIAEYEK
ncbi:MAG: carboxypeptidase-like regulatory domain-containing protein [Chitinophagales bacterium]